MAVKKNVTQEVTGFDVTCIVGRVEFSDIGPNPGVAAFMLIAEHDAPGTYSFPNPDGSYTRVTVEYEDFGSAELVAGYATARQDSPNGF
jgi:hypothetical protein